MMEIPVFAEFFTGEKGNYITNKYPDIDWSHVAEEFVTSLGLKLGPDLQSKLLLLTQFFTQHKIVHLVLLNFCAHCVDSHAVQH